MPDSDYIEFHEETAAENAKAIVKMAVENFKTRNQDLVNIPQLKTNARVGSSVEAVKKELDGVCNLSLIHILPAKPSVSPVLTEASFVKTPISPQQILEVLVLSLPFGKNMLPSFSASPVRLSLIHIWSILRPACLRSVRRAPTRC